MQKLNLTREKLLPLAAKIGLIFAAFIIFNEPGLSQTKFALDLKGKFDVKQISESFGLNRQFGFAPDGKSFFAISNKQNLTIWETATQTPKHSLTGKFLEAVFSPDGKHLAIMLKNEILLLDSETGKISKSKTYKGNIKFLDWNPTSKSLAIGAENYTVDILNGETGETKKSFAICKKDKGFLDKVLDTSYYQAKFTNGGEKLLTFCDDPTGKLWNPETGEIIFTFTHPPSVSYQGAKPKNPDISWSLVSPNGKWILTMTYDDRRLWNAQTGELVRVFNDSVFFSSDGRYLQVGNESKNNSSLKILDLETLEVKKSFPNYPGRIVAWSSDGKIFVTNDTDKKQGAIWEMEDDKETASLKTYAKSSFDFVSSYLTDVDIFRFSPNDKILMVQNQKEIKFLNSENGEKLLGFDTLQTPAVWSHDGKFLLSKSKEKGKLFLYEVVY